MSAVLVTGAGRGIGRGVCAALAADGRSVVLHDLDGALAERAAREIAAAGGARVVPVAGDVADPAVVRACVAAADGPGGLEVAVANAGVTTFSPFLAMERAELERLVRVNLLGTWTTAQEAARALAVELGPSGIAVDAVAPAQR